MADTVVTFSGDRISVVTVGVQGPAGSSSLRSTTLAWAATVAIDWGNYDFVTVTLAGNTTFTFTGASAGQRLLLELIQDDVGSRTVTLPATVRYGDDIPAVALSSDPGTTDKLGFIYSGTSDTYDLLALSRGFI